MNEPLLKVTGLVKSFGGIMATNHLSLDVAAGEVHAVIGPNGAGKTTMIAQLAGMLVPDNGTITFDGADITRETAARRSQLGLARSFQITSILKDFTVLENVAIAVQAHSGHSFKFWARATDDSRLTAPALEVLERVGLADRAQVLAENLAHGEQRQLEIAMVLATRPKLLLLDEPTAGMGPEDSAWMANFLHGLKGDYTILLIEHDMDTVFALSDRVSVLVYGQTIATGTPDEVRANREVRIAYLGEEEE
jgi:branched-chain amino acid transport system ATP-binding protein